MEKEIVKRRKFEKKAQKVVFHLAQETVSEETLITVCKYIEPYHFEEIVEERYLAKICGYPLCPNELTNIPKQKYQISIKSNKVYDITDRKRYCSNNCYKSSKYVESQIPKQPVWTRESLQLPLVKLLKHDSLVQTQIDESTPLSNEIISKSILTSTELEKELNQIEYEFNKKLKIVEIDKDLKENLSKLTEVPVFKQAIINEKQEDIRDEFKRALDEQNTPEYKEINNIDEKNNVSLDLLDKVFNQESNVFNADKKNLIFLEYVLKRIINLITADTRSLIKGDTQLEKTIEIQKFTNEMQIKANLMYKKANGLLNSLNKNDDNDNDDDNEDFLKYKKPLPSYEQLKEETKLQELKVKAFFDAKFEVEEEEKTKEDTNDIVLPIIDSQSQRKIRENIFSDKLIKNIENVLKFSNFKFASVSIEFKEFFKYFLSTLNLTNENIVFRTNEWSIVSLIMAYLMSLKFESLRNTIINDKFLPKLLEAFNLNSVLLDRIINFIMLEV